MSVAACVLILAFCNPSSAATTPQTEPDFSAARVQSLVETRRKAQEELNHFPNPYVYLEITSALDSPGMAIAVVIIDKVTRGENGVYSLQLRVERTLRGNLPQTMTVTSGWHEGMWGMRPPFGWDRIKPEPGKRVLAGFNRDRRNIMGPYTLDLDNPEEAKWVRDIEEFLRIEAKAGEDNFAPYLGVLLHRAWFVRYLALNRLVASKACRSSASCEHTILASIRKELASLNPNDRFQAVNYLRVLADSVARDRLRPLQEAGFKRGPIRALLMLAVADKNVVVGDEAFLRLATLDFDKKENIGYCGVITPALRKVEKRPETQQGTIGGRLNAASICLPAST
ncbi:MAG TPA: hypothetical protein VGK36_06940 [Candidatus Angelobacter sp.]|jgi:hypothetical protein